MKQTFKLEVTPIDDDPEAGLDFARIAIRHGGCGDMGIKTDVAAETQIDNPGNWRLTCSRCSAELSIEKLGVAVMEIMRLAITYGEPRDISRYVLQGPIPCIVHRAA